MPETLERTTASRRFEPVMPFVGMAGGCKETAAAHLGMHPTPAKASPNPRMEWYSGHTWAV